MADEGYYDADGNWVGSGGTGAATAYKTPAGLNTDIAPATENQRLAVQNERYLAARGTAEKLQNFQFRQAQSDLPPGSDTNYLDRSGARLGPIERDEFQIPKPAPLAATGLRGYPGTDEIRSSILRMNAQGASDQFDADVNSTIGRYQPAPRFAMPSTDQLIDVGIQAKRNQLQNEINTRVNRLPTESDQPVVVGGNTRHPRYAPSQAANTRAELAILTRGAGQLDSAQQANIANRSKLAIESAKQNELVAQDTARAQVVDFISNIDDQRYPHGSPDREAFIGKVFGNRPDWLHVMAKDKDLSKFVQDHVDAHTTVAATMDALKQQYPDTQFTPSVNAKGGVSYRGAVAPAAKEEGKLAALLHKQTGLTPDEFAAIDHSQAKAGGIFVPAPDSKPEKPHGVFHDTAAGFTAQGTPKGEFSNDFTKLLATYQPGTTKISPEDQKKAEERIASSGAIQIDTGKGYKAVIPRTLYQRYLEAFGNEAAPSGSNKVISVEDWLNQ